MLRLRDPNAAIFLSQIFAEAVGRRWLAQDTGPSPIMGGVWQAHTSSNHSEMAW